MTVDLRPTGGGEATDLRAPAPRRSATPRRRRNRTLGWFIAPAIVLVVGTLGGPVLYSLWLSIRLDKPSGWPIGIDHYLSVFEDDIFPIALRNTLLFAVIAIVGSIVLGLAMALVLNEDSALQAVARVGMLVPWAMSQVAVAVIWGWIYNGTFGSLNGLLTAVGITHDYKAWLNDGPTAFTLLGVAFLWSITPYATLLFLTGLQAIPSEQYEAATLDRANAVQRFRHVTLPWLRNSVVLVLVIASLEGFLAFALVYVLTSGGPGYETTVLAWWGYSTTFSYGDVGKGAAILYILTLMVMGVSLAQMRALRDQSR